MTAISILNGDWEILLDDEKNQNGGTLATAGMRTIQKAVASPTIVTTRTLYSAVAEAMDDFIAMGFRNGMLPTTPNAFTLENFYFMPRSSAEFLKEGAITANWALTGTRTGDGVLKKTYSGGTAFILTDIGRRVTEGAFTGTLLDYDQDPDGTTVAWIRPDDPSTDVFTGTGALSVTGDGGTGASTSSTAAISGATQWSAVQAIGAVPTATEVYIYQDRIKLPSSNGSFQWWTTDATASLGIISILVQVKNSGVTIADGDVEVFARRYTSLYDNFRLNVVGGGFSALPLASAPDINNTTGYWNSGTLTGVSGTPTVGNGIYVGASWAAATAKGVITAANGTTDIDWYEIGDLTAIGSTTAITGYDFDTQANDGFSATTGTVAATSGGPTDATSGEGGTVAVSIGGFLIDHDGDSNNEPYSVQVDAQTNVPIAKVYERIKYITRRGATAVDLFGAGVNVPGESYRGLDGIFEYDANTSAMNEGEDVDTITGGNTWTARLLHQNTTNSPTYITVTDQQTSLDSVIDNNVISDEGGAGVRDVTVHAGGTVGLETFTSPKSSPFGTFTGTQIFGARGVAFVNPGSGDAQSYILTDDLGILNSPPNTVTFTITNTAAGDRVYVARDTGTAGIINKDQFGGMDTPAGTYNGVGDQEVRAAGTVDPEVPASGYVRVVETTKRQEHRYVYSSRTTGLNGVFTLLTASSFTGAATATDATGPVYTLTSTGKTFQSQNVEPGMLIRNTTTGDFFEVVDVTSETTIDCVEIHDSVGAGNGWTNLDNYEINRLIQNYTTGDNLYDLILDAEATTTSINNTFVQSTLFDVVVNVRQGKIILPFTLNQAQGASDTTVTVVRQPDTIAV
jgi:hypothetical protein